MTNVLIVTSCNNIPPISLAIFRHKLKQSNLKIFVYDDDPSIKEIYDYAVQNHIQIEKAFNLHTFGKINAVLAFWKTGDNKVQRAIVNANHANLPCYIEFIDEKDAPQDKIETVSDWVIEQEGKFSAAFAELQIQIASK